MKLVHRHNAGVKRVGVHGTKYQCWLANYLRPVPQIQRSYSLKTHNTFGIDVKADAFVEVLSVAELTALLGQSGVRSDLRLILGGGSNILFTRDVAGLVLNVAIPGIAVDDLGQNEFLVTAGAGVVWHHLVEYCVKSGLGGIENLSLIPGRVGAAPMQNIGAYGVELKDVFHRLEALHIESGELHRFTLDECQFGYRESVFKRQFKGQFIITSVTLKLRKHAQLNTSYGAIGQQLLAMGIAQPSIADVSRAVIAIRQSKLPDPAHLGNAGSFFKNPVVELALFDKLKSEFPNIPHYPAQNGVKLAAGWLIEQCGWKGKRIGNTGCHEQQALVIVNYGAATGQEIVDYAMNVTVSVNQRFGVALEQEVNLI